MKTLANNLMPEGWLPALVRTSPILLGLMLLYAVVYQNLYLTTWNDQDQAHGPIIVMVVLYLFWMDRAFFFQSNTAEKRAPLSGWLVLVTGLLLYLVGRVFEVLIFELGSQILVLAGVFLITRGWAGIRKFWFALFFLVFMIPLPGFIVDAVTLPMKIAVSYVAEYILYGLGYPIARSGVVLQIGQYQLLVADACAGLHTLVSLEALGLLYLNIIRSHSVFRNITLTILIVPISFTANVIRVMTLTLITYYFGDAAGQGFMHGFAGMLLFVVALMLIIWIDSILQFIEKKFRSRKATA
ncbi:exosortase B [Methylobacillus sp.]|uniref:exosortase B n=1 Tax=Methylobacillus sp. TaxID=56818 RepID=UPI0012CB7297|nr:exosortase B [Methylobacillus sp.]MPS48363.1 exosortase B [Methylobacillus sp.]